MPQSYRKQGNTCIRGGKIEAATVNDFVKICSKGDFYAGKTNVVAILLLGASCTVNVPNGCLNRIMKEEQNLFLITVLKHMRWNILFYYLKKKFINSQFWGLKGMVFL